MRVDIDITPPSVPTHLQAVTITSITISLSWTPSTDNVGVAGYRIQRGTTILATVDSGVTTFTESGLSSNTSYSYAVLAIDAVGNESALTPELAVTTARAPLVAPSGSVAEVTSQSIQVRWGLSANATRYTLAGSLSNNPMAVFQLQRESSGTDDTLSGLMPNTTYYLFLNACDETDCTEYALISEAVTFGVTPALKSMEVRGREAQLSIDPKGNPVGTMYRIEMSRGGGAYVMVAKGPNLTPVVGGLVPGERYAFRVMAENRRGVETTLSNEVAATILAETVDGARAYPVPFRPGQGATGITFDRMPENTTVRILTMDGRSVKTLTADAAGGAQWDLTNDEGQSVSSGVYLVILKKEEGKKLLKVLVPK